MTTPVRIGLQALLEERAGDFAGARLGLLAHPASVLPSLEHAVDAVAVHAGLDLVALFGPQHGIRGEKQDNMIESASFEDARTGLPVHSLYGEVRKPKPEMLDGLDVLLVDLQDVGVRIYTFAWTMMLAMEACREAGVKVVVLDRPNPIDGVTREGPLLREGYESFVGLYPLPLRHGLTLGEEARVVNGQVGCELDVIPCEGWSRKSWHDETGLPFVFPSPNLPTLESCVPYPGTVLLEGTNMSEGRGTTRPFELIGAPYFDAHAFAEKLRGHQLPGLHVRPCWFEPTFQKHAGQLCGGAQLHVLDRHAFRPVLTAVAILRVAKDLAPDDFRWLDPPYEYEEEKPPIDILWGSDGLREGLDSGAAPIDVFRREPVEIAGFEERTSADLLYS